jgi:hypothetical protein
MAQTFIGRDDLNRGLRNNNVGNITTLPNDTWEGQIGTDGKFVIFKDIAWGVRAWATNYYSQITKHGVSTLREYISGYAPASDQNAPDSYTQSVADYAGVDPDGSIPQDTETVKKILRGQIIVENGSEQAALVTDDDINEGFTLLSSKVSAFFKSIGIIASDYANRYPTQSTLIIAFTSLAIAGYIYILVKKKIKK